MYEKYNNKERSNQPSRQGETIKTVLPASKDMMNPPIHQYVNQPLGHDLE